MIDEVELYSCVGLPIFQNRTYDNEKSAKACPKGDLSLVQNLKSGLIYNASFRSELVVYDEHYQNEQALSPAFREHLLDVSKLIEKTMGREQLIEVGCGKGFFLEAMIERGVDITGFDPAYEGNSDFIKKQLFQPDTGMEGKGLILRHVLEHIQNPVDFLVSLAKANGKQGLIYIEVPCFDWIQKRCSWFDLFYEHVNYFRLEDFNRMFGRLVESGRLFGGQYLYAIADLATIREPIIGSQELCSFPPDFMKSLNSFPKEKNAAVWGASSKGVIFSLMMQKFDGDVSTIIDINPAKQGRYLPGTGKRVSSPEEALETLPAGSTIFVMNSNYLDEIKCMSNHAYHYVSVDDE